jgi:hypothetical protein
MFIVPMHMERLQFHNTCSTVAAAVAAVTMALSYDNSSQPNSSTYHAKLSGGAHNAGN